MSLGIVLACKSGVCSIFAMEYESGAVPRFMAANQAVELIARYFYSLHRQIQECSTILAALDAARMLSKPAEIVGVIESFTPQLSMPNGME